MSIAARPVYKKIFIPFYYCRWTSETVVEGVISERDNFRDDFIYKKKKNKY